MLPQAQEYLKADFVFAHKPSKTFRLDFDEQREIGRIDGLEAVRQAVFMILNTERYQYLIHSWNYGAELQELIGMPIPLALSEIKHRIQEALMQDSRITAVDDFKFDVKGKQVTAVFTVYTIYGGIEMEKAVDV